MGKRDKKKPIKGGNPYKGKVPRGKDKPKSISQMKFRWRTNMADMSGNWGWRRVNGEVILKEIIPRLHSCETMKWSEIESHESHFIPLDKIIKPARDRLEKIGIKEDYLFSLRVASRKRVWGIRTVNTFHIVWWDPNHEICPTAPN